VVDLDEIFEEGAIPEEEVNSDEDSKEENQGEETVS